MGCGNILPLRHRAAVKPVVAEGDGNVIKSLPTVGSPTADVQGICHGVSVAEITDASILKVEERAILLPQLQELMDTIKLRLDEKSLMSTGARPTLLSASNCNLYDTVHHFIKPATMQRKCSYVELVAEGPQLAQWFVSHWWGEPVVQFIACVAKHLHHRKLAETVPYWVCAYANNQWQLNDELGRTPSTSSFRKALDVSHGTLSILDNSATVYTRIWCDYEVFVTLDKSTWTTHLYDIYTWQKGEALGLTDGVAQIDQRGASWWWEDRKQKREQNFPFELARAAMQIQVQRGEASVEEDRRRILHAICGTDPGDGGTSEEPPLEHPNYEAVNATLHARFALTSWILALQHGQSIERYARALSVSHLTRISLSFRSKSYATDEMLKTLAMALPKTLKELCLVMTRCKKVSDEGIVALSEAIQSLPLEHLHLDFAHDLLTDSAMEALCPNMPRSVRNLWLSIGMCNRISDISVQHLADALGNATALEQFFVSLVACPRLTGQSLRFLGPAMVVPSASGAQQLRSYSLLLGSCALEDEDLLVALDCLPQGLEEFVLDCWACKKLSSRVLMALREKLMVSLPRLRLLELTFGEIPEISGVSGKPYAERRLAEVPEILRVGREELEIRFYT